MIDWSQMPESAKSWREAGLFDAERLPQPTSAAWLVSDAPPTVVLSVLHIGVVSCFATSCPMGQEWMDMYGTAAGEHVRAIADACDMDELAAAHDDLDAVLRTVGPGLLQPELRARLHAIRRVAVDDQPFTAHQATELASISYRRLDHWARQGWVTPALAAGAGRGGTRCYCLDDVLRLASLRHFADAGRQVNIVGEQLSFLEVGTARFVIVGDRTNVAVCDSLDDLCALVGQADRFTVFDTAPLRESASRSVNR